MFENTWVYIDKEQLEALTGFKVGYGTGAYVCEAHDHGAVIREYLTLDPDRDYVYQVFRILDDGTSVFQGQNIVERDWVDLNMMNAEMLDRLDPYRQRIEFPCNGGKLFAEFAGDRGIYDGIVVCFKRGSDDGEVQCALVETITAGEFCSDARDGHLLVHVWDYADESDDSTATYTVDKDTDCAVMPN